VGGGRDVSMHRQIGQKRLDPGFGGAEVFVRPPAVEPDESSDPLPRGALDGHGVVVQTEPLSHIIEESGVLICRRGRPTIPPWWCPQIADHRHRAQLPDNPSHLA
jgi:hypothetical protein